MKSLMFAAFLLLANNAVAGQDTVWFSSSMEGSNTVVNAPINSPSYLLNKADKKIISCDFIDSATDAKTSYSADIGTKIAVLVLPIEKMSIGVKTYVAVSYQPASDGELVDINKDCKLPVGATNVEGTRFIETFKWGQPVELKLTDGTLVTIQINRSKPD